VLQCKCDNRIHGIVLELEHVPVNWDRQPNRKLAPDHIRESRFAGNAKFPSRPDL
jgi:hypothetical protein